MGAYLSEPVLDKHSSDESSKYLSFGASSMQGWRVSQEDAHNAILDYCQGKSLFAVYDGHGGHEVAAYCSLKLPDFLKTNENFQKGNYKAALEEAFIQFDATLIDKSVVEQLRKIAGNKDDEADEDEEGEEKNEVKDLFDEAEMPIEDLVAKYSTSPCSAKKEAKEENGESGASSLPPHMRNIKAADRKKPVSPFLRAKTSPVDLAGGSGSNKHIRFNEDGTVVENGVEEDKKEVKEGEAIENGSKDSVKSENGESETKTEPKEDTVGSPQTPAINKEINGKNGVEDSPEGSEKENKDINAKAENQSNGNGEVFDDEGNIVKEPKGKGKGKGKGKSKGKSEDPQPEVKEKRQKKSAEEIYDTLKKAEPEEGDEDSEDSDDMEFGEAEGLDEEDSDEELGEEEEEESDEDSDEEEDDGEEGYEVEAGFNEDPGNDSGCTAVVALLAGTTLYVANAGDSRCVVCRDGKAVEMSFDHKPEDDIEMQRIVTAGGKVTPDGRVNGGLNLSRAIGDHAYKKNESLSLPEQMISPQPDIKTLEINPDQDNWMILACDGIWNFMSSQEVVDYISQRIDHTPDEKLSTICEELFEHCLAPDTMGDGTGCDNMTAVIVKFKQDFKEVKDVTENKATNGVTSNDEASDSLESEQPAAKKMRLDTAADPSQ